MSNYKISIQYDGTQFFGWQSQPNGKTIQDYISKSIYKITQEKINLIGSGRTDSGVHSLGQVANFHLNNKIDEYKFKHSLNSILPPSISIDEVAMVPDEFHARFDAKSRIYYYLIRKNKSPFYDKYSYLNPFSDEIDVLNLNLLSNILIGKHDFSSFCKAKTDTTNKICIINEIFWKETYGFLVFKVEANRFLHGMVRTIVGTLLFIDKKKKSKDYLKQVLVAKNRQKASEASPAKGLFLYKVKY